LQSKAHHENRHHFGHPRDAAQRPALLAGKRGARLCAGQGPDIRAATLDEVADRLGQATHPVVLRAVTYDHMAQSRLAARQQRADWAHALATGFVKHSGTM